MSNWEQSIKEFINNGNYMDGEIHRVIGSFSVGDLGKRGGNKCIFSKYDVMKGTTINFYDTEGTITFDDNCYIEAYFGIGRGCNIDIGSWNSI